MVELIVTIILVSSFLGMGIIIFRKIPVLLTLPEIVIEEREGLISKLKKTIKKLNPFKNFFYENFLQKILMRVRILTLKTDNKTFNWLKKIREKNQKKKKNEENGDYWEEIRTFSLRSKTQGFSSSGEIKTTLPNPKTLDSLKSPESKKDKQK